eukprot:CAMPEP_0172516886 /NCGR_PEP_ID=MMETSP1066-20121228/279853_1 /TAXON_ID=671091 /ORGANISM="Coscinodiscus wailesii, Strain CCMP2513" /LENGTH=319 /DNA_ID=CAMNT_0013298573 /DNA_START=86 /DNA_END=1045 /DNA_ORIENTATION=+
MAPSQNSPSLATMSLLIITSALTGAIITQNVLLNNRRTRQGQQQEEEEGDERRYISYIWNCVNDVLSSPNLRTDGKYRNVEKFKEELQTFVEDSDGEDNEHLSDTERSEKLLENLEEKHHHSQDSHTSVQDEKLPNEKVRNRPYKHDKVNIFKSTEISRKETKTLKTMKQQREVRFNVENEHHTHHDYKKMAQKLKKVIVHLHETNKQRIEKEKAEHDNILKTIAEENQSLKTLLEKERETHTTSMAQLKKEMEEIKRIHQEELQKMKVVNGDAVSKETWNGLSDDNDNSRGIKDERRRKDSSTGSNAIDPTLKEPEKQ